MGINSRRSFEDDNKLNPLGNIRLAVKLHSVDEGKVEFWPAMGTHEYGSKCGCRHCIHNDSWEEIKAHPDDYWQCITDGCTKTVTIDETYDSAVFSGNYGDEAGMLYDEIMDDASKWSVFGDNSYPTYIRTLEAIKKASDIPEEAHMKLLTLEDMGASMTRATDDRRVIYDSAGRAGSWWLADPCKDSSNAAYSVSYDGGIYMYFVTGYGYYGIAPAFSY